MTSSFPWYDSQWLDSYLSAKMFIQERYPQKLTLFTETFNVLRTRDDFQVIPANEIFEQDVFDKIKKIIAEQTLSQMEKQEMLDFGRLIIHNQTYFNNLQKQICHIVSDLVKEELEPSYNFLSLYSNLGICPLHMDAPNAKWTLDICIDQSDEWPIYFSEVEPWPDSPPLNASNWENDIKNDQNRAFSEFTLKANEGLIFSGSSQWHYRNRITSRSKNNFCHLLFFHFIPKGTAQLVNPAHWANIFDIPELTHIIKPESNKNNYEMSALWGKSR